MLKARGGLLAAIAVVLTAVLYGRAWRFDLQCDDLLMIRPWSSAELVAVWHGTWEPGGAFAVFFRPLATWFYAGTFELFGWNAPAHMLLSLAMLAIVGWLVALFVMRESGSGAAGFWALLFYFAHPNVPWSTGTWVTNDFHKLTAISALCALLVWQRVRSRAPSAWLMLVPFVLICFLVKEDGVMLIPVLVSLQWARARFIGDVTAPGLRVVAIAASLGVALVMWRYLALGELGGFGIPPAGDMLRNLLRGPLYAFTMHGSLSVLTTFELLMAMAVATFVALGIVLLPRERRYLPFAGLILMFWYDLPLALISNVMRYYMLTIAGVMVLAAAYVGWASRPPYRWVVAVPIAMLLFVVSAAKRQEAELNHFAPCQRLEHECVPWVLEEVATLPAEARAYVAATPRVCAASTGRRPRIGENGTLTWGLGPTSIDTDTGERSHAVAGEIVSLIRSSATSVSVSVRHPLASAAQPVRMEITADGAQSSRALTTPDWTSVDVPLGDGVRTWLRGAHRIDAKFSSPGAEWRFLGGR